jgi:hypothetical protein
MVGPDKKTERKNKNAPNALPFSKNTYGIGFNPLLVKTKDTKSETKKTPISIENVFL